MIRLLDKSQISVFDYLYLFLIIIYAGNASAIVTQFGDIRTIGNAIPLLMTFLFAYKHKIRISDSIITVLFVLMVYSAVVSLVTHSYESLLWEFSRWVIFVYIAYVICKGYERKFIIIAETILYHLGVISIVCWLLLLFIPDSFTNFVASISLPWRSENYTSFNAIVYTINDFVRNDLLEWYFVQRNAGFAWEPGAFGCFMCFGLFFNMLRTNYSIKGNNALIVFLIALASTQSTTGYVTFGAMLIIWLIFNRKFKWLFVLVPVLLAIMNLPFLSSKITVESEGYNEMLLGDVNQDQKFDRILSFRIYFLMFLNNPFLGYGYSRSIAEENGLELFSGIGQMLAQYGVIMVSLFFCLLYRTSKILNKWYNCRYGVVIIVTMLGMMISYRIWIQPFFLAMVFAGYFMNSTNIYHRNLIYKHKVNR